MSHTPGPWTLTHIGGNNHAVREFSIRGMFGSKSNVYPIFNVDCRAIEGTTVCMHPDDARLVVAAPDLFEAMRLLVECKDVKDRLDGWEAGSTQEMGAMAEWYDTNKPKAWEMARAAIAKAEGQS